MDRAPWPLGRYCARVAAGLWGEPLNTGSNIAFVLAALAALHLWRRSGERDGSSLALVVLLALIGVGSFAFHAAPSRVTLLMDMVPIQAFILLALFSAVRRYLQWRALVAGGLVLAFLVGSGWVVQLFGSRTLAGGVGYLPPLFALVALSAFLLRPADPHSPRGEGRRKVGQRLMLAAALFSLSLTLRTLDRPLCPVVPVGLHFLWHILNAAVLFLIVEAQLRHGRSDTLEAARGDG